MAVQYVGPYSPAVYAAANKIQSGGGGVPYSPSIISAANKVIASQPKATTSGGGGGGTTAAATPTIQFSQPDTSGAQNQVNDLSNQIRDSINSGYNDIFSQLDNLAGLIPGQQKAAEENTQSTYDKLSTGINQGLDNANKTIDITKQQIQGGVDKSVSDIQNSLRSLLKSAQSQVGAMGAGNSSVAQTLLPYAFSKQYGQQRANIQGQANSQFTDLAKKALDVQTTFNQQKMSLDQWQSEQMQSIRDKYAGQLQDIANAKINATGQRLQALTSLQTNLLNAAQTELLTLKTNAQNLQTQIAGWAADRLATLDNLKLTQQNNANYNPSQIVYNELQGLGMTGKGATQSQSPLNLGVTFGGSNKDQSKVTL